MGDPTVAVEIPAGLRFLRPHAVALLNAVVEGDVNWVVQRSATYGHIEGRRCTKTLRTLATFGAILLPARSGPCVPTDAGRAALDWYPDREKQFQRP
jgi:hypothetical protein